MILHPTGYIRKNQILKFYDLEVYINVTRTFVKKQYDSDVCFINFW